MPSKSDKEFGHIALRMKLLTQPDVEEGLRIQTQLEASGTPTSLERVLLAKSRLTPEQVGLVQKRQSRRIVFCDCGTKVNVFKYPPGKKLYCRNCRNPLFVPTREELENSIYRLLDEDISGGGPDVALPLPENADQTPVTVSDSRLSEETGMAPPLLIGQVLANRKILAIIGQGGMGTVFKARHMLLDRVEAFKIVSPQFATDPAYRDKFLREARIAASLHHPHITRVFDVVSQDHVLGYAMEFIEGEPLSYILQSQGPLAEEGTLRVLRQLCSALQCIHEAGIVHRDIKPGNVLIDRKGDAVLTDLGLAKPVKESGKSGYTSEGATLGTPAYMAPEQIENAKYADIRTDIYSLGALAYHTLVGRPPFQKDSVYEFLSAILHDDPVPPHELDADISLSLSKVVMKMLSKKRDMRYLDPTRLAAALEKLHA
jgi:predicted Ser/Thr protein kinase